MGAVFSPLGFPGFCSCAEADPWIEAGSWTEAGPCAAADSCVVWRCSGRLRLDARCSGLCCLGLACSGVCCLGFWAGQDCWVGNSGVPCAAFAESSAGFAGPEGLVVPEGRAASEDRVVPEDWDALAEFLGREVLGLLDVPPGLAGNSFVSAAGCCGFLDPLGVAGFIGWRFFASAFFCAEPFCLFCVVPLVGADLSPFAFWVRVACFCCGVGVPIWRDWRARPRLMSVGFVCAAFLLSCLPLSCGVDLLFCPLERGACCCFRAPLSVWLSAFGSAGAVDLGVEASVEESPVGPSFCRVEGGVASLRSESFFPSSERRKRFT